ncbi:protein transport protein Sec31A isoform X1 [Lepisosteus oculatus]|uniref:protein transport protein Sec31A isoform X1 n=1 Tax=Lepisosteus oculatus TaxID=7918 RepID=UPI00371B49D0
MKLKEIQRTAQQAWSPASLHPAYLATGTSAQQLDASFSTSAALEIFEMDFADPSQDMKLRGTLPTSNRFHSLIWVNFGMGVDGSSGRLVGGGENGVVTVYSPEEILASGKEAIIGQCEKHTGPVRALDFNPFQSNLLASGANDSEIYIWDLNNFNNPMTPGTKSQPHEDISVVAWNRQVQHILASAHPSGKAVVWDLRKNEPIIKISDHSNRMHCSGMLWHPEVATQLVLASEDDRLPVIQMWDLRFATSPLKVLENHTRGILSVSWSQADPELLLSSAKDNRILCWNPTTGEVIYELPTSSQWCFDVQWCPRNPALLSAASFDGRICVYSVMGGSLEAQQQMCADKISSSFSALDSFGTGQALPPLQVPQKMAQTTMIPPLKKPPKWIRRHVGASFAFGGKLITFENPKSPQPQGPHPLPRKVFVSQVTTETEFLQRSSELQAALQSGSYSSYCQAKIHSSPMDSEQNMWSFLKVNFEEDARVKFLRLLGFSKEELEKKISSGLGRNFRPNGLGIDANDLAEKMQHLSAQRSDESSATGDTPSSPSSSSPSDFFSHLPKEKPKFQIPVTADTDGLISQALLVGNFESAVELCLSDSRYAEAILLAISGGEELLRKTQQRYLDKQRTSISMLISSIVTRNWTNIVQLCDLDNWKEALAALLTYAQPEDFSELCDTLGARLECEGEERYFLQACLCYICSGNVEKLVECWVHRNDCSSPLALEDLVEKVMILRRSIEKLRGGEVEVQSPLLAEKLTQYASLLAAQGSLVAAMSYLPLGSDQPLIMKLWDRLFHAQGEAVVGQQPPPFPYTRVHVGGLAPAPAPAPAQPLGQKVHQPGIYQPGFATPMVPPGQPPVPTAFPPQPAESMPSHSYSAHVPLTSLPRAGPRAPYPQHPATASGFPPHQPFGQPAVPLGGGYPSKPTMPASSLAGPSLPPSSAPGALPAPPSPAGPPPSLMSAAGRPSASVPPSSQAGGPPHMYPGGHHPQASVAPLQPSGPYGPAVQGYSQGGPGAPASQSFSAAPLPPPPTGYFPWLQFHCDDEGPQDGWNDPPTVRGGPRKKKLPENYTPPAPITAPVMGFPVEQHALQPQVSPPHERVQAPPGAPQEPSIQSLHQLPAEKIEKREIPPEHLVLKTTFDSLVQRCLLAAGDPQTKRKLDDASKRLEYLYDKLREHALSPSILAGLHEVGRCIEGRNYQQALAVHTQIVSSSNFSEISAFMPVLKVVMTIANKLGV